MKSPIDIFAEGARDGVYPGGQLAVSRECERLVTASVGVLGPGLEPTHDDVIYDLASLTKALGTTLLFGRALEQGKAKIDDPARKYVPGLDPRIKLEHLLEHSSGYPAHQRFDTELPSTLRPGSWDAWRHIIFKAAAAKREADPGEHALYSDIGFILLGAALEIIYSKPLSMAHALLGTPLLYRDSRGPPALPKIRPTWPIAPTEGCNAGEVHDENARAMGGAAGHAGLFGNANGVLKLAEQLVLAYHGWRGGVLKPETVRRLWQPSLVHGSTWALGWDRPSKEGSSTGGRWPSRSVGHLGFTGTSIWIEPERGLIAVLVTNRVCPTRANNTIRRLRPLLYDSIWEAFSKPRAKPRSSAGVRPLPADEESTQRIEVPMRAGQEDTTRLIDRTALVSKAMDEAVRPARSEDRAKGASAPVTAKEKTKIIRRTRDSHKSRQ